ncbi:MAG: 50S ribosomal protein L6 [bacterium]
MSRIGRSPIQIPSGVTVSIEPNEIKVDGPKGSLTQFTIPEITVTQADGVLTFTRLNDEPKVRSKHGLMRSLVQNMVTGVTTGFEKKLEINGVGYRVALAGTSLKMQLGFSHEVVFPIPAGVNIAVEANTMTVTGISKQQVGQVAAEIRSLKKPEPYKGKGIKYVDERIIRKSGKSGKEK